MADRYTKQAEEILAICKRMRIEPDELGADAGIMPETMRKYSKGYQKASDHIMQSLRNVETMRSVLNGSPAKKKGDSTSPYAGLPVGTLERILSDHAARLPKSTPQERKHIIGQLVDVVGELEQHEFNSKPPSDAATLARRADGQKPDSH